MLRSRREAFSHFFLRSMQYWSSFLPPRKVCLANQNIDQIFLVWQFKFLFLFFLPVYCTVCTAFGLTFEISLATIDLFNDHRLQD